MKKGRNVSDVEQRKRIPFDETSTKTSCSTLRNYLKYNFGSDPNPMNRKRREGKGRFHRDPVDNGLAESGRLTL